MTDTMGPVETDWHVICEARDGNSTGTSGKNEGGLVIYLTNGVRKKEVESVAYVRRHSSNAKKTFKAQLQESLATAEESAKVINDTRRKAEELKLRAEETRRAAERAVRDADDLASRVADDLMRRPVPTTPV